MRVVVLLVDTLRYDHVGFNGNSWIQTPNMDRLAARSLIFDRAYLGSYPCMPARRDLYTGRYEFPSRGWGPLEHDDRSLPRVVTEENGVTSMIVTDHYHLWEKGSGNYHFDFSGYEFIRGQEYDRWQVWPDNFAGAKERQGGHLAPGLLEQNARNIELRRTESEYFPAQTMSSAAQWLERNRERESFLLMVDCFDPHEPFDPPKHYVDLYDAGYGGEEVTWPTYGWNRLSPEETAHARALYAGEITLVDRWVGVLLDTLDRLGLSDDTSVVLTTDHGHMFGEHGTMGKPWSAISDSNMYEEVAHVPLVLSHPELVAPRRVDDLVQIVDLYPTVLEALGLPVPEGTQGRSLIPYVRGGGTATRPVACFGRFGESLNVTDGEWTLFLWPPGIANGPLLWHSPLPPQFGPYEVAGPHSGGAWPVRCARGEMSTQLFNVRDDPGQQHDRAAELPKHVERLRRLGADFLREVGAPSEQFIRLGLDEGVQPGL